MEKIFSVLYSLRNHTSPKDAILETEWFKQSCKEADEKALQNLREMLGQNK
jgi:hypothetical protein